MAAKTNARKKKQMLTALEESRGIVSTACIAVGINRTTHYNWKRDDSEYAEAVEELENAALDFVESKLLEQIEGGSTTAIIFYLKTKGKRRGYSEREEGEKEVPSINITIGEAPHRSDEDIERILAEAEQGN